MKAKRFLLWGLLVSMVLVLATPAAFAQYRYTTLPQIALGAGWSSNIFATNQDKVSVSVTVFIYASNGAPLSISTSLGTASSFTFTLNGGASQVIRVPNAEPFRVGYVVIKQPSNSSVTVTEIFDQKTGGLVVAELGVPQLERHHHHSSPVEINLANGINTGVALCNPTYESSTAVAQTLVVNLIAGNGTLFRRALVPLGVGEHKALFLNEAGLFPGIDNFTGTLTVSGAKNFGVLVLRSDRLAYGTVAVNYGPVLTPFVVSSPLIGEAEPNSTRAQAQLVTVSSLINGTISSAGDIDYYTFNGKGGDVISAMIDTQGAGSSLNSSLYLERPDGTIVASSDSNGLYGQVDALIHCVLPYDGQYYVKVFDSYGSGGYNYTYKLHLMFPGGGVIPTQPQISSLNPTSADRGTNSTLVISGTNLSGASAVAFNPPTGITVSNVQSTATQVTCQVAIASDATVGSRQVAVSTSSGTSNSLTFTVNPGGGSGYDGTWSGSTSAGTITFTVANNKVMSFEVTERFQFSCCALTKFSASSASGTLISGSSFSFSSLSSTPGGLSFSFTGTFSSSTQASGSVSGTLNAPIGTPCCAGSFSTNWNATKGTSATQEQAAEEAGTVTYEFVDESGNMIRLTFKKDSSCVQSPAVR